MADENNDKHVNLTQKEQVLLRPDQHIGTAKIGDHKIYIVDDVLKPTKLIRDVVRYSPGLVKCFDEILNNAADHKIKYPKLVTYITVDFNDKDYSITIKNNGPGIPIDKMECNTENGKVLMYKPQAVFSELNTSSSYVENDDERVTGGLNGYGAKLVFLVSLKAYIETIYKKGRTCKKYTQTFNNNLTDISEPLIETSNEEQYTLVKFTLDFERLGMDPKSSFNVLNKIFYTRTLLTCDYLGIPITYNGVTIIPTSDMMINLLSKGIEDKYDSSLSIAKYNKTLTGIKSKQGNYYKWDISIMMTDKLVGFQSLSVVNGLTVLSGSHINHIKKSLVDYFKPKIQRILTKSDTRVITQNSILDHFVVYIKAQIPNPGWSGQTKEKLNIDEKLIDVNNYKLGTKFLNDMWVSLNDYIMILWDVCYA